MQSKKSNLALNITNKHALLIQTSKIIFYLLAASTVILLLNTPIFARIYGIEFDVVLKAPLPHYYSVIISILLSLVLIGIMYLFLFKINPRYYDMMRKFFLARTYFLPICIFFVFMVLVFSKMLLSHTSQQNVIIYMVTILFSILADFVAILTIIDSIVIQYLLVKSVIFDIVKSNSEFYNQDIYIIISTYLNFTFTFATIYFHMQSLSEWTAFHGIETTMNLFESVVNCVYFSFITISTTGYGDIYPVLWYAKLLVCVEVLSGVFLLTFSFGIILNSISNTNITHRHNSKQPVLSIQVTIRSKRSQAHHNRNDHNLSRTDPLNHVTVEFGDGERTIIHVPNHDYDLMVEEDTGILTFQGSHFLCFDRAKNDLPKTTSSSTLRGRGPQGL